MKCTEVTYNGAAQLPSYDISWVNHWKHVSSITQLRKCSTLYALWEFEKLFKQSTICMLETKKDSRI